MEPLTALGVVANILQLLSFCHETLSLARDISVSPDAAPTKVVTLEGLVAHIRESTKHVRETVLFNEGIEDKYLRRVAQDSDRVADKLLTQIKGLRLEQSQAGLRRGVNAVRVAVKFSWNKKEIYELKAQLLELESRLEKWWTGREQQKQNSMLNRAIGDIAQRMEALECRSAAQQLERLHADLLSEIAELRTTTKVCIQGIEKQRKSNNLTEEPDKAMPDKAIPDKAMVDNIIPHEDMLDKYMARHSSELQATLKCIADFTSGLKRGERQLAILYSLKFPSIKRRQAEIEIAHHDTVRWIYNKSATSFLEWLEARNGVYWISGQAGSGKSTVMKFIASHKETLSALQRWAGDDSLVTASHFFWHAGTNMEKSQQGLLQSLLFNIFRSMPRLIDAILPSRSAADVWDIDELKATFRALSEHPILGTKFCFFIDGLDEYGGSEERIIEVVKDLARSTHIKVCVSSRPWSAFLHEWNSSPDSLKVETLTQGDMAKYIKEKLADDPKFLAVASEDPRCYDLVKEISRRGSGVWLWVFLVVRDLLRDMRDREPYEQLLARLNSYPADLNDYFEDIMLRIDPLRREQSAIIFLLVYDAASPLSVLTLTVLDRWNDPSFPVDLKSHLMSVGEIAGVYKEWLPRLQNRCRDLLKITYDDTDTPVHRYRIDFLHRTVRDFLREHHQDDLRSKAPKGFDSVVFLSKLQLFYMKHMDASNFRASLNPLIATVDELLLYAWVIDQYDDAAYTAARQFELLDNLDETMSTFAAATERRHWTNARDEPRDEDGSDDKQPWSEGGEASFLALAIQARLHRYVAHELARDPALLTQKAGRPLLDYALRPLRVTPITLPYNMHFDVPWIDVRVVATLLDSGADPNRRIRFYDGQSPWRLFLHSCHRNWDAWSPAARESVLSAMRLLLRSGAEIDVKLPPLAPLGGPNTTQVAASMPLYGERVVIERTSEPWVSLADFLKTLFPNRVVSDELLGIIAEREAARKRSGFFDKFLSCFR